MDTERLLARLEGPDEGFRQFVYDDATGRPIRAGTRVIGNPTVGIGLNLASVGLSLQDARFLTREHIQEADAALRGAYPWYASLNDARQGVICEMEFNMGLKRLGSFRAMIAAIEQGDWKGAAAEMLNSSWHSQVGQRAVLLASIMESGSD